jgi:hypothetical protein
MWVEVTARAEAAAGAIGIRVEALMRDVTERKKLQDQAREVYHQAVPGREAPPGDRRCPESRHS